MIVYNPLISKVIKLPTRTVNREVLINLPSKEGLIIKSEISILYRIKPEIAKSILTDIGLDYDKISSSYFLAHNNISRPVEVAEIQAEDEATAIKIQAEAQVGANKILNANLTPVLLELKRIEAFIELSKSDNSKLIITDGKTPLLGLPTSK